MVGITVISRGPIGSPTRPHGNRQPIPYNNHSIGQVERFEIRGFDGQLVIAGQQVVELILALPSGLCSLRDVGALVGDDDFRPGDHCAGRIGVVVGVAPAQMLVETGADAGRAEDGEAVDIDPFVTVQMGFVALAPAEESDVRVDEV